MNPKKRVVPVAGVMRLTVLAVGLGMAAGYALWNQFQDDFDGTSRERSRGNASMRGRAPTPARDVLAGTPDLPQERALQGSTPKEGMLLGSALPELSTLLHSRLKEVPGGTSGVFIADDARKSFCKGAPERWKELSSAIAADPAALLAFLRLPESESILTELLYLVETEFKLSPSVTAQIDAMLAEFLASGSPRQKLGTLGWLMRESSKGAVAATFQSKPTGELYLELLSGTDPEVARDALYGLAQYCGDAFVSNFDRVKEACDRSRDTGFKTTCLYGLAYQKGPRAEALYLEQTAEALQGSIEEVRAVAVTLLDQTLSNRLPSGDETSYFAMLSRVIDAGAAPSIYPNLLEICFRLPRGQCVTLLEQARQKAPTPELLGVTNGVLEMVNRGETRREVLRRALSP